MGHFTTALKSLDAHVTAAFISLTISTLRLWFYICWCPLYLSWISSVLSSRLRLPPLPPPSQKLVPSHFPVFKGLAKVYHNIWVFLSGTKGLGREHGTGVFWIMGGLRSYIIWWVRNTISQSDANTVNLYTAMKVTAWWDKYLFWRCLDLVESW